MILHDNDYYKTLQLGLIEFHLKTHKNLLCLQQLLLEQYTFCGEELVHKCLRGKKYSCKEKEKLKKKKKKNATCH